MKNNLADLLKQQCELIKHHDSLSREILYTESLREETLKKLEEINKSIEETLKEEAKASGFEVSFSGMADGLFFKLKENNKFDDTIQKLDKGESITIKRV